MSNRLPEKLAVLRKEYGFTQSDVAQKLNISVTDYMNWENGNKLCTIEQLKVLADMYGVTVDALADNTKEITGKPEKNAETIDIPFMTPHTSVNPMDDTEDYVRPANQNATQELSDGTIRIDMGRFNTRPAPSPDEQPTMTQTFTQSVTIRPKREEPKEEPVTEHPTGGRKRRVIFISAMIALAGILCVLVFALLGSGGGKVGLSQTNRIALGDRYSLYVDKSGQLQVRGIFEPADRKSVV